MSRTGLALGALVLWLILPGFAIGPVRPLLLEQAAGLVRPSAEAEAAAWRAFNLGIRARFLVPRLTALAGATSALATTVEALCAAPDDARLAAARTAWHGAVDAWMEAGVVGFGPARRDNRSQRLHFWPQGHGRLGPALATLLADDPTPTPLPVAATGLSVLEPLLFAPAEAAEATSQPRCAVMQAAAREANGAALALRTDWRDGADLFARLDVGDGRLPPRAIAQEFLRSFDETLSLLLETRLDPALADPAAAEMPLAGRGARNIARSLAGLEALWASGFSEAVAARERSPRLAPLMERAFAQTRAAAEALADPLQRAVRDPAAAAALDRLRTRLIALRQLLRERVAPHLGLIMGFNALDGD